MDNHTDDLRQNLGTMSNDTYNYINNLLVNPIVIIFLVILLVLFFISSLSLGNSSDSISNDTGANSFTMMSVIMNMFLVLVVSLLLINVVRFLFGIDIVKILMDIFMINSEPPIVDKKPEIIKQDQIKPEVPQISLAPQVFNIPENDFNYTDAKALCSAYGARLATYDEMENAYKSGGEWCNYGWSDGQMALFPTQKSTYDKLQKIEGHENDCGRPGVNGGFIKNPEAKFGVNCYGYKPRMTETEKEIMATRPIYPKTIKDKEIENRVNYWKDKLSEITVSPFNHSSWSKI